MDHNPIIEELDLVWADEGLTSLAIMASTSADRPEVEYRVIWQCEGQKQRTERVWLDAVWSIPKMSGLILDMLLYFCPRSDWSRSSVQQALNRLLVTYGCEEPF